jgi:hypothetical protein
MKAVLLSAAMTLVGLVSACSDDEAEATNGLTRIGTVDGVSVFALPRQEEDGTYLSVVARASDGSILCNGSSGIESNGLPFSLAPTCSDRSGDSSFTYVLPVLKSETSRAGLCRATPDSPVSSTMLTTPDDWTVDLIVYIDRTQTIDLPSIAPCALMEPDDQ